jgi:hypothetical protein
MTDSSPGGDSSSTGMSDEQRAALIAVLEAESRTREENLADTFVAERVQMWQDIEAAGRKLGISDLAVLMSGPLALPPSSPEPSQTGTHAPPATTDLCTHLVAQPPYDFGTPSGEQITFGEDLSTQQNSQFANTVAQGIPGTGGLSVAATIGNLVAAHLRFPANGNAVIVQTTTATASLNQTLLLPHHVGPVSLDVHAHIDASRSVADPRFCIALPDAANLPEGLAGGAALIQLTLFTLLGGTVTRLARSTHKFVDIVTLRRGDFLGIPVEGSFAESFVDVSSSVTVDGAVLPNFVVANVALIVIALVGGGAVDDNLDCYVGFDFRDPTTGSTLFFTSAAQAPGPVRVTEISLDACPLVPFPPSSD